MHLRLVPLRIVSFAPLALTVISSALGGCANDPPSEPTTASTAQELTPPDADVSAQAPPPDRDAGAKLHAQLADYARCMREHGVDWPDPPEAKPGEPVFIRRGPTMAMHMTDISDGGMPAPPALPPMAGDGGARLFLRLARGPGIDGGAVPQAARDACAGKLPKGIAITTSVEGE